MWHSGWQPKGDEPVTQSDTSLAGATQRSAALPFRHSRDAGRATFSQPFDPRTSWHDRMGLTLEEALQLSALSGTTVVAGGQGLDRAVRHMVVDDPSDPLGVAGPDVLVVLGARLPPGDPAHARAPAERRAATGPAARACRGAEGAPPVPGEVLAEAERRSFPVLALPGGAR